MTVASYPRTNSMVPFRAILLVDCFDDAEASEEWTRVTTADEGMLALNEYTEVVTVVGFPAFDEVDVIRADGRLDRKARWALRAHPDITEVLR